MEIDCDDSTWLELAPHVVVGGTKHSVSLTRELIIYVYFL
jgi:hypothetical protein